ncbi:helix-turn-helix transcriptional regulator [Agromyces sp. SYSU K20354]|uniref:helix-turn-helix domain-containing protein n=1 Tax=Agromyces cavernae TaxID=2898659 RepID=UPI001E593C5D|nr:helix-turn-helix transcriptional regulator [Agromyces cavernae]MCD2441314.1 helix-turn-helix transcriptional regulator [Agromyces cavernae]
MTVEPRSGSQQGGIESARRAYERRDWRAAVDGLEQARVGGDLSADDLYTLANAAWWLGEVDRSIDAGEAAYRRFLQADDATKAAMSAMWVAMNLLLRGDDTLGSGWMRRAVRLVEERPDTVEHHYLRYVADVETRIDTAGALADAEFEALVAAARDLHVQGRRFGDFNLVAAGSVAEGRILLKRGRVGEALGLLDEAMLTVLHDEMMPEWAGNVYCHLMTAWYEIGELDRAKGWTEATESWLETIPSAVLFRGICRVHRSQVLQALGSWDRAAVEAQQVCVELDAIAPDTAAEGHYQLGDLARLRGDHRAARAAYLEAHGAGRDPQPGMALLRLAEGRDDLALTGIRAAIVAAAGDPLACVPLQAAHVQIALAAGELAEADEACAFLEAMAEGYGTPGFVNEARTARGRVELGRDRFDAALPSLREACAGWRAVGAVYDGATARVLLAEAYRGLGDDDAASIELEAAAAGFDRLGIPASVRPGWRSFDLPPDGLTAREVEVLALVATGRSNRDVARALTLSEKTVARHLSNIYAKIGADSRTEAAAYAFRHRIGAAPDR